jgi:hypothetical protein
MRKAAFVWLVCCAAFAVLFWLVLPLTGISRWRDYRRLAAHGVRSEASVTAILPKDHATARYHYQVAGRTHEGQFQPWPPNPPLEELRLGQAVAVYYDPLRPDVSVLGEPGPILRNETEGLAIGPFVFSTVYTLCWFFGSRRRARRDGSA